MYAAVPALLLNLAVSAALTLALRSVRATRTAGADQTDPAVYFG